MNVIEKITGEMKVHTRGYCVGGTLLAATLAWLAEKRRVRVTSATLLTRRLTSPTPANLLVFVDEEQIAALEEDMQQSGVLEGNRMAMAFNMLRANDLIWPLRRQQLSERPNSHGIRSAALEFGRDAFAGRKPFVLSA